jgi:hypothetical protein
VLLELTNTAYVVNPSIMSKAQRRVALIIVGLIALGFGIIWFISPGDLHLQIGAADIEMYKHRTPLWLQGTGLCAAVLLLACWWKYRKPN